MLRSWIILTMIWINNPATAFITRCIRARFWSSLDWNLKIVLLVFHIRTQFRSGVRSLRMAPCSASRCAESACSSQARRPRPLPALPTFSTVHLKSGGWKQPRWTVWWITCLIPAAKSRTMGGYFFLHTAPSSAPTNSSSCFSKGTYEYFHSECMWWCVGFTLSRCVSDSATQCVSVWKTVWLYAYAPCAGLFCITLLRLKFLHLLFIIFHRGISLHAFDPVTDLPGTLGTASILLQQGLFLEELWVKRFLMKCWQHGRAQPFQKHVCVCHKPLWSDFYSKGTHSTWSLRRGAAERLSSKFCSKVPWKWVEGHSSKIWWLHPVFVKAVGTSMPYWLHITCVACCIIRPKRRLLLCILIGWCFCKEFKNEFNLILGKNFSCVSSFLSQTETVLTLSWTTASVIRGKTQY